MSFFRTLKATAFLLLSFCSSLMLSAQSYTGNILHNAAGYYGGFEAGNQTIGANAGLTDLTYGSDHGAYQIVNEANKPWAGGGYLPLQPHSGENMMLVHTDKSRLWYKPVQVSPGQRYEFFAWIASAKEKPVTGFEVRLLVKYGNTTTILTSAMAQQGSWSKISASFTVPAGVNTVEFQLVDPFPNGRFSNFLYIDDVCIKSSVLTNPDVNTTYVNVAINGNVSTNDVVSTGATYGTPAAAENNPAGAVISMDSEGHYSFSASAPGVYVYKVPVCGGALVQQCPTSLLTIYALQAAPVKNAPVAHTDFAYTSVNSVISLNTLANDAAGNAGGYLNPASVTVVLQPKHGKASVNSTTGLISYSPDKDFIGNDTLQYQVCDNSSSPLCATAPQIITVLGKGVENTTIADDDYAITLMNAPAFGNVLTNDMDMEGHTQQVAAQSTTINGKGTLMLKADGTYSFHPATGYTGPVSFPYTTCDNGTPGACAKATLYLLVQAGIGASPLPVSLLSFTGKKDGEAVRLNWETATESNSSHFVVEHSTDGAVWTPIGTVTAAGNSNSRKVYTFRHATPSAGANQYRLNQKDVDGHTATISSIITIRMAGRQVAIGHPYPNPFVGKTQFTIYTETATKGTVQLFDISGRMLQRIEKLVQAGENVITIDKLESLNSGTYFISVTIGEVTMTEKLLKN